MPGCHYDFDAHGDACDREYERARQELDDAFVEGKIAGLEEQRFEMNPFLPSEAAHARWAEGWREGVAQRMNRGRRAA